MSTVTEPYTGTEYEILPLISPSIGVPLQINRYNIYIESLKSVEDTYHHYKLRYCITDSITLNTIFLNLISDPIFDNGSDFDDFRKRNFKYRSQDYLTNIKSILSCSIEDLATHVNDPDDLDKLVYWRYSL